MQRTYITLIKYCWHTISCNMLLPQRDWRGHTVCWKQMASILLNG